MKLLKFAGEWNELENNFFGSDSHGQNFWNNVKKSRKIGQEEETLVSIFALIFDH